MSGLALGHYHSYAKNNREYQHTHTVVRRERREYVGWNDRKNPGFTVPSALWVATWIDGKFDVDAIGRLPDQCADLRDHLFVHRRVMKDCPRNAHRHEGDGR